MPLKDRRDEALVRRAFVQFALLSVGLIVLVLGGVLAVAEVMAHRSAEGDATTRGGIVAQAVAAGLSDPARGTGDPDLVEEIEAVAQHAGVRAVLVWDESGTVVWSTRPILVGETFQLDAEVRELFGTTGRLASDGDLDSAHPRGLLGSEVEVFAPIRGADGSLLVAESYVDGEAAGETRAEALQVLLPLGAGGLLLFEGLALLAGARLARRVHSGRRERIRLLTASLAALDHERRRIAHDLHDGIVQNLAAMRYALTAVTMAVPEDLEGDPHSQLQRICDLVERELAALRGTMGELLPVERQELPLPQTLRELMGRLVPPPTGWSVEVEPALENVDPATAELAHRVVQEGVRNAVRHARATSVTVLVQQAAERAGPAVRVVVEDDGRGPSGAPERPGVGGLHVGIRLLRDLARDLGGDLRLGERPGGGTRLVVEWERAEPAPAPAGAGATDHDGVSTL